jgi:hypothetical protein
LEEDPCRQTIEAIPDTVVMGQVDCLGPYSFINTLAHGSGLKSQRLNAAVVVRINHYGSLEVIQPRRRDLNRIGSMSGPVTT